jgi:hypothetical protein
MKCDHYNQEISFNRPNYLDNKIIIVDGLIGGGKGLLSAVIGSLPRVEMWIHRGNIEQICAMNHLSAISSDGVEVLLKSWFDEYFYNLSLSREVNIKPSDMSSLLRDARPLRYLKRLFHPAGVKAFQRIKDDKMILNVMTHSNTAYSEPIFKALGERLVYIRLVRSPMTKYMINHLARWSERWGNDQDGIILYSIKSEDNSVLPCYTLGREDQYIKANHFERTILLLDEWQNNGNKIINKMKKISSATIIEIPFEKFVFEPNHYVNQISKILETEADKVTKRMMKKQRVPRLSLTDAPKNKVYESIGWIAPKEHISVLEEFEATRKVFKNKISAEYMRLLDNLTKEYISRYDLI